MHRSSFMSVGLICASAVLAMAQDQPESQPTSKPAVKKGLLLNTPAAFNGYTLYAPLHATTTYLVDMKGEVAHSWPSKFTPGVAVYLQPDGSILRCGRAGMQGDGSGHFRGGGIGSHVERIAPDGAVLWDYKLDDDDHCLHHDIAAMPNGHVLMIAWEKKSKDEAVAAGRDPKGLTGAEMWPDEIIEVEPQGADGGKIVWEWHVWDHIIQNFDKSKPNFGIPSEHPELVDLNFKQGDGMFARPGDMRRLRAIGYVGGGDDGDDDAPASRPAQRRDREDQDGPQGGPPGDSPNGNRGGPPGRFGGPGGPGGMDMQADWLHTNSIAYNAKLDQILISIHNFSEVWIIDHSTKAAEAASHAGGKSGKGGDLLYRWGNPKAYGAGIDADQKLFAQHDAKWIPDGLPGAGHITVFNNGGGRKEGQYSSVVELAPPVDIAGRYARQAKAAFGPSALAWEYTAPKKEDFFSGHISGAQRLPNGDTLICNGEEGRMFEVDKNGATVWDYNSPHVQPDGMRFRGGPAGRGPMQSRRPGADSQPSGPGGREDARPPRGDGAGPDGGDRGSEGGPGGRFGPGRGPGGFGGPGGFPGGPGGGGPGGVFKAVRYAADDPGVQKALQAKP